MTHMTSTDFCTSNGVLRLTIRNPHSFWWPTTQPIWLLLTAHLAMPLAATSGVTFKIRTQLAARERL